MEDVKTHYGAATQAAAERVETGHTEPSVPLLSTASIKPAGPAASVYGSPAVAPEPVAADPTEAAPGDTPAEGPLTTSVGSTDQAVWEFEVSHGWKPFHDDCQSFIERQYQKFQAGSGKDQIHVKTQSKELSVNFTKMTQKLVGQDTIRKVRRRTVT